jgi:hypothetical protein
MRVGRLFQPERRADRDTQGAGVEVGRRPFEDRPQDGARTPAPVIPAAAALGP